MLIQNIKSSRKFEATKADWDQILSTGNAHKYRVIQKDEPIEVRSMRSKVTEEKVKTKK